MFRYIDHLVGYLVLALIQGVIEIVGQRQHEVLHRIEFGSNLDAVYLHLPDIDERGVRQRFRTHDKVADIMIEKSQLSPHEVREIP